MADVFPPKPRQYKNQASAESCGKIFSLNAMTRTCSKWSHNHWSKGRAYVVCPISAGTTNAIRPPGCSRFAVVTRNGAQEDERLLNLAPRRAHDASADFRVAPLKCW